MVCIVRHQGKHPKGSGVVVCEGDRFDVRSLLVDHIAWRQQQGAKDPYDLFAWPDGTYPVSAITELSPDRSQCAHRPDDRRGERGVQLQPLFRYQARRTGLWVAQIAEWLGSSSRMIEGHYNRFLTERNAHLLNGASLRWKEMLRQMPHPVDPWETDRDIAAQMKGA